MVQIKSKGKYIIKLEPNKYMGNYWGMNHQAGKALHFNHTPPRNVILVAKTLSIPEQRKVIIHEKVEEYMMREKHLPYSKAHQIANAFEMHAHVKGENRPSVKAWEKKYNY